MSTLTSLVRSGKRKIAKKAGILGDHRVDSSNPRTQTQQSTEATVAKAVVQPDKTTKPSM